MTQGPCQPLHTVCWHGLPQSALVCQQVIWRHSANDLRGRILAPGHVPEALCQSRVQDWSLASPLARHCSGLGSLSSSPTHPPTCGMSSGRSSAFSEPPFPLL